MGAGVTRSADDAKRQAAARAVELVRSGMKLGLGTGSTAAHFVELLAARVEAEGLTVRCVPTSKATELQAGALGLTVTTLDETPFLDLTVDGADEIDPELRLIKGGGGALLREKIVAAASERMVVIADASKQVDALGAFPLPVEVVAFGVEPVRAMIDSQLGQLGLHGTITERRARDGSPFVTDGGNRILDCALGRIPEPDILAEVLKMIPGVVETGLFINLADQAIVAGPDGITVIDSRDA